MGVATPGFIRGSRQRLCLIESLLPPPALLRAAHSQSRASPQGGDGRSCFAVHSTVSRQCYEKERANRRAAPPFDPGHVCSPKAAPRGDLLSGGTLQQTVPPQHQAKQFRVCRNRQDRNAPWYSVAGRELSFHLSVKRFGPWAVETAARSEPALMKTGTGHSDRGTCYFP